MWSILSRNYFTVIWANKFKSIWNICHNQRLAVFSTYIHLVVTHWSVFNHPINLYGLSTSFAAVDNYPPEKKMTFMRPQHTTWLPDVSALTYNGCTQTWWNHTFIRAVHRLFTVPRFPWDLRCWLVSLTFCHIGFWTQVYWGEYKMPLGRVVEGPSPLHYSTNPTTHTHWYFLLSLLLLASRDQDGSPSNSTITTYNLKAAHWWLPGH